MWKLLTTFTTLLALLSELHNRRWTPMTLCQATMGLKNVLLSDAHRARSGKQRVHRQEHDRQL